MQRARHPWVSALIVTASVTAFLLAGAHLSAQTPGQPGGSLRGGATAGVAPEDEEFGPKLFSGAKGEIFRLSHRIDPQGLRGLLLAAAASQPPWQTVLRIFPPEKAVSALSPDAAAAISGELAVAYEWRQSQPRSKEVRLARSNDGGKTWTQSPTPVDGSGKGSSPKLGWGRGRTLVVVWEDERRGPRLWDIYARRSPDGGVTWEPEQQLSRFPQQVADDVYARTVLVSDGADRFWAVWVGLRSGRSKLYLSQSTDGGRTWADPVELTGQSQSVYAHRLVRSGERLLLVWQDMRTGRDRIYAVSSADGGATWTRPTRVDHVPAELAAEAGGPAVVMSPTGEAFVVWFDGRNGRADIFVGRSLDGGRTWESEDVRLDMDEPGTGISGSPTIARAPDGRIAVAWEDDRAGYESVYLRIRGTGEQPTWSGEVFIAPPGPKKSARTPGLLWGNDGALYVAWEIWDFVHGPLGITKQIDSRPLVFDKR